MWLQSLFTTHTSNPQDEDCLKLNIWAKTPKAKAKKPVLIWFHGGSKRGSSYSGTALIYDLGFTIPGSYSPFYNG